MHILSSHALYGCFRCIDAVIPGAVSIPLTFLTSTLCYMLGNRNNRHVPWVADFLGVDATNSTAETAENRVHLKMGKQASLAPPSKVSVYP